MADAKCSKCESPLDRDGYPKWCKSCWNTYYREYEAMKKQRTEARGYAAGANAMRELLVARFTNFGRAHFSGIEAAHLIRRTQEPT